MKAKTNMKEDTEIGEAKISVLMREGISAWADVFMRGNNKKAGVHKREAQNVINIKDKNIKDNCEEKGLAKVIKTGKSRH